MKRKIVKHGGSTLTVSLPSSWVKVNKIKEGGYIDITPKNDELILTLRGQGIESINWRLTSNEIWYVNRTLRHLYTSGYDEIKIEYTKEEQLQLIRNAITVLTGFEIVESKSSFCRIRCITPLDNLDYNAVVERILWLIQSQFDYFLNDCNEKKPKMYKEIIEINKTVIRLNNLCRRAINKKPIYDAITSKYVYWFLSGLMDISSFILYSYDYSAKDNKLSLTQNEIKLAKTTRDFYYSLLMAYKNLDIEKTRLFFEEREKLFDNVLEILKEKSPVIIHYFLDILKSLSVIGNLILNLKMTEASKDNKLA